MKTIKYSPRGKAISDFEISQFVNKIFSTLEDETVEISSHLVVEEIRARINEKIISLDNITILVLNENEYELFPVDKNGRSKIWFDCQCVWDNILIRLI